MRKFIVALLLGIVAGLVVYVIGVLVASIVIWSWTVSLGNALQNLSGVVAFIVFLYYLICGIPTNFLRYRAA